MLYISINTWDLGINETDLCLKGASSTLQIKLSLCFFLNWESPHEGVLLEWRYSSTHSWLGTRWRWAVSFTPLATLPPGKEPLLPLGYEAGWTTEPVWTRWWREKFSVPVGIRTPDHPACSPALYHWAIPAIYLTTKVGEKQITIFLNLRRKYVFGVYCVTFLTSIAWIAVP
jgi:hypothetical protein